MKQRKLAIILIYSLFLQNLQQNLHGQAFSASKPSLDLSFLPQELQQDLQESGFLTSFRMKPKTLKLVPFFSGRSDFIRRHETLEPHAVQEALFLLSPRPIATNKNNLYKLLMEAPSLAGLSYNRKKGGPVLLFRNVRFITTPDPVTLEAIIQVEDTEFGTIKFKTSLEYDETKIILKMINLDPLSYLVFPAVPPGQALVDIVYGMGPGASFVYTAWSVRAYLFIPSAATVETPLYRRAISLKNWFISLLETLE
ncbi:DUF6675 family protein [Gracilinema caldarium]|uniref:Uncharacterized protein n=1 Tax=Gracilinema caldarium (strain ATCC 51460 / DSM 7334 / H1) TaxID=744872 RepID=F8F1J3_GRAC1|nr:DUF6675 family protein [Gracilinema caldarium]AEJ19046.1 hypothetical protein Spica_0892 [Gracilinema caldarium DSM 7334]